MLRACSLVTIGLLLAVSAACSTVQEREIVAEKATVVAAATPASLAVVEEKATVWDSCTAKVRESEHKLSFFTDLLPASAVMKTECFTQEREGSAALYMLRIPGMFAFPQIHAMNATIDSYLRRVGTALDYEVEVSGETHQFQSQATDRTAYSSPIYYVRLRRGPLVSPPRIAFAGFSTTTDSRQDIFMITIVRGSNITPETVTDAFNEILDTVFAESQVAILH